MTKDELEKLPVALSLVLEAGAYRDAVAALVAAIQHCPDGGYRRSLRLLTGLMAGAGADHYQHIELHGEDDKWDTKMENYVNPSWEWDGGIRVHDWRRYVSDDMVDLWPTMTLDQRREVYLAAHEQASNEEWD
ncbi:TPA: hypothetical protein ACP7S5_004991 [Escherichia coli]